MKKLMMITTVTAAFTLTACNSRPSPQTVANKICSMGEKYIKAEKDGKEEDVKKITSEVKEYSKEINQKYKDDEIYLRQIDALVEQCKKELEKKYDVK